MRTLRRIAFFWMGQDTLAPSLLVHSVRRILGPEIEIIQLSDKDTPEVAGVSTRRSMKLPSKMMLARLEAYASLTIREPTLFLDADMLLVRNFDLPSLGPNEVGVTPRHDKTEINWRFPIDFPEFEGKYFFDEMPYVYSFVYTSSEILFVRQLNRLRKMPKRFHVWYGDQVTLKRELDSGPFVKRVFDIDTYNRTIQSVSELEETVTRNPDVCLVHFKGYHGKNVIRELTSAMERAPSEHHSAPFSR